MSAALLGIVGCSSVPYATVGIGYKLEELDIYKHGKLINDPISARFEVGLESENTRIGVTHHSQYFKGWPVDSEKEYSKTEVFFDYVWRWK